MNIEKTYKLTIKGTTFNLTEEDVTSLYETCCKALNISITGTNPIKPFDNPIAPMYPTWPNTYPGTGNPTNPLWHPYVTSKGTNSIDNSVMDNNAFNTTWSDMDMSKYSFANFSRNVNKTTSSNINFI